METLDLSFDFKFLDSTFSVCMRCTWTSAAVSKFQSKFHAFHTWLLVWDLTLFSGAKKQVAAVMHFSSRPEAHHIRGGEGQKYVQFKCVEANVKCCKLQTESKLLSLLCPAHVESWTLILKAYSEAQCVLIWAAIGTVQITEGRDNRANPANPSFSLECTEYLPCIGLLLEWTCHCCQVRLGGFAVPAQSRLSSEVRFSSFVPPVLLLCYCVLRASQAVEMKNNEKQIGNCNFKRVQLCSCSCSVASMEF